MIDLKNLVSLPTYTTTVPSTGKKVSFRPFVVKEEKILLIALESKDDEQIVNAIKHVLSTCFMEKMDLDELTYFDIEYLFIQLRMKSMGEVVEIIIKDPKTNERFETEMKLENIKVENIKEKQNLTIKLSDNLGVIMKYPSLQEFIKLETDAEKNKTEAIFNMIVSCVDKIFTKDQVFSTKEKTKEEIKDFLENLPKEMFVKISNFFDNMPEVVYVDEYTAPTTGNKIPIVVKDFRSFFV
jgi:hypothetical protein